MNLKKSFSVGILFSGLSFFAVTAMAQEPATLHNPKVDLSLSPVHNRNISPEHNPGINPKTNWNINPAYNKAIKPAEKKRKHPNLSANLELE